MKSIIAPVILFLTLFFLSCEKEPNPPAQVPGELIGYWINPQYNDSLVMFERAEAFNDGPGFHFLVDGSLVEHKNAGFCGTPPITYADYDGSYSLSDSILIVNAAYWGGTTETTWKLISLNSAGLTIKMIQVTNGG